MERIEDKKVVTFSFIMRDGEGVILDSSQESGSLNYIHGQGQIMPALEKALEDRIIDEKFSITFTPEQAYGMPDEGKYWALPKNRFDEVENIEPGQHFELTQGEDVFHVVVREITEDEVIVDGNHPLAGKTLIFDIDVKEVRDPSEEELELILKNNVRDASGVS